MDYSINEQPLAFNQVLPWAGQAGGVKKDKTGKVFLQIEAPEAKRVSFVILEEEYTCSKDNAGLWQLEFPYQWGFTYVQLKIDDVEVITPALPIGYGYGRPCNYVVLAVDGEDFYHIKPVPHGSVRREYYFSRLTGEWESCMVYTPPSYDDESNRKFPVLYLQHGHGENEIGWTVAGKVNFILDNLIAEERAKPFLVVMCNGMVQTHNRQEQRIVDYQLFGRQLMEDIIPFIEKRFRTGGEKSRRAMAGLSMGSLQTSRIGFTKPEFFSALGIFSGFMTDIIQGGPLDMVKRESSANEYLSILDNQEAFRQEFKVFFRAIGEGDQFYDYFQADDRLCAEKGVECIRKIYQGGHDWNVWRQCIKDFAQLIFQ